MVIADLCTVINHLMGTLKPQSSGPLYNNAMAVDTARRGLGGLRPRSAAVPMQQPTHQRPVYRHIIRCGTSIISCAH